MDDIDDILAQRVRRLRDAQGLSQEQLALRAGLHERYVGQLERGERGATVRSASKLAQALGVRLSELVGEDAAPVGEGKRTLARLLATLRDRREDELKVIERVVEAIFGVRGRARSSGK